MKFNILHQDSKTEARLGEIHLARGVIETPNFVPVGTQASVKALSPRDLTEIGVQVFFSNTYHLYLRPGADVVARMGGLHKFMNWNGPIMTDSGGFQVFSLGLGNYKLRMKKENLKVDLLSQKKGVTGEKLAEITEEGVKFKSHLDGSEHLLNPEISMQIQSQLGADILMAFDDCTPYPCEHDYASSSVERTHRWLIRSKNEFQKCQSVRASKNLTEQNLYGVVQGSTFEDLRIKSAKFVDSVNTLGIAIGGVSVGESKEEMIKVLDWVMPYLSDEKPRHLLGVGEIDDIFMAVERGVDTMDCVIPTRWARNGALIVDSKTTKDEQLACAYRLPITNSSYVENQKPIDRSCNCYVCQQFTRAYLNHLYRANEILGIQLGTYHNVYFLINLMSQIRDSLRMGNYDTLKKQWLEF